MANIFINKEERNHVVLTNGTGADLALFDFTVIAPYCAVADEVVEDGGRFLPLVKADLGETRVELGGL